MTFASSEDHRCATRPKRLSIDDIPHKRHFPQPLYISVSSIKTASIAVAPAPVAPKPTIDVQGQITASPKVEKEPDDAWLSTPDGDGYYKYVFIRRELGNFHLNPIGYLYR